MIKLENVNKYFNHFKKNEIHVINNTSLEFGDTGLVALLGPSGCGKTTLLNAIGGLDRVNKGKIYVNGKRITKVSSYKKDKIRVLNIGYIFQNYDLLENLTVYENISLSLKMIGIKNRAEIKKRVDYVLEQVGMYRYRNKPAGMLSGGEKQRVGIARAIVKNPSVIIADEPTGNLDSKNTLEIMNIIKSISKDRLVILVTHEKNLAYFYASRIVTIEDGKILTDENNNHENELDYRVDNRIYLKDIEEHERIENKNYKLDLYRENKDQINLDIVIKNGNIYIKSNGPKKIEVVDEYSSIEFIDDNYKKISKNDYEKTNFDLNELDNSKYKIHYSSIFNIFSMIKAGIKKVFDYSTIKKVLLIGFFVSAMFIVYAISNIFGVTNIKDSYFVNVNKNYIVIENTKNDLDEFLKLEKDENISYVIPGSSLIEVQVVADNIYQLINSNVTIEASLADYNYLECDLLYGKLPTSSNEVVIDKLAIENIKDTDVLTMIGYKDMENLIGAKLKIGELDYFNIVGISDTSSPSIYMDKNNFTDVLSYSTSEKDYSDMEATNNIIKLTDYDLDKEEITIKKGREPINDYEVLVNIENEEYMPLNKVIDVKIGDNKLKVVGYYESPYGIEDLYVNRNTIKYNNVINNSNMMVYSLDKRATLSYLKDMGYNAIDTYKKSKDEYLVKVKENITESVIIAGILLLISFVEIFLMIRASFMSRIKEVGIYRAIGVKKSDIYKMFLGEILVITTIAGVPGFVIMSLFLKELTKINYLSQLYLLDFKVLILSLFLIYFLNILIGLLPIRGVIKNTPSEILSRNDVD